MTLDRDDIEAIAELTALKLFEMQSIKDDSDHMARLIKEGRGAEVKALGRSQLLKSRKAA